MMIDDVVDRLHHCIVAELRERGHEQERPLKVLDLYEEIVPYSAVRARLDVELNADYEHALLRLLAGEGGLLRLGQEEARQELEREVREPYPAVGIFRKFAGSEVWVRLQDAPPHPERPAQDAMPAAEAPPSEASPLEAPPSSDALASSEARPSSGASALEVQPSSEAPPSGASPLEAQPSSEAPPSSGASPLEAPPGPLHSTDSSPVHEEPAPDPRDRTPGPATDRTPANAATTDASRCAFCDGDLPVAREVRFCPFCGRDKRLRPCPRCDEVLEPDWRYCIRCGHDAAEG
jgi:hypothetical protein